MGLIRALKGPQLVVNFKAYLEATGKHAVELAKLADEISKETGVSIIITPQFTDIKSISERVSLMVFSQHLDPVRPGPNTGHVLAEALKSAGAVGSLLNHSERRLQKDQIHDAIKICSATDLYSLVCADTAALAAEIAQFKPDILAVEPPDLIGTGVSVSKARPELITESVQRIRAINSHAIVLCGAGISTSEDVSKALELGMQGVLVASSVVKSKDPRSILSGMAVAIASAG